MIFVMKQTTLEPGLLQTLRVYVILMTILLPFVWRAFSQTLGVEGSLSQYLTPGQPVVVFLIIYLSFPWWQRRMGRAFLPVAFLLLAAQAIFGNYLTLQWLVPPPMRDRETVSFSSCNAAPTVMAAAMEPGPQLIGKVNG